MFTFCYIANDLFGCRVDCPIGCCQQLSKVMSKVAYSNVPPWIAGTNLLLIKSPVGTCTVVPVGSFIDVEVAMVRIESLQK